MNKLAELCAWIDCAKAADLGVNVQDVATTLNVFVGGQKVSDYYEGGEQYEVRARVPAAKGTVALRDIVTLEEGTGLSIVNRIARQRQVLLTANVKPGFSSQAVIDALTGKAKELKMPAGCTSGLTGRSREQGKAASAFLTAFILSIIFMYLIFAAQFESRVHPVSILLALPLAVPFALLSIVVLNQSINIFSSLGILQIDNMISLRNQGVPRDDAIRRANRDRLRPILITTLALVLTLVGSPVAYSIFDDWSTRRPLASLLGRILRRRSAYSDSTRPSSSLTPRTSGRRPAGSTPDLELRVLHESRRSHLVTYRLLFEL